MKYEHLVLKWMLELINQSSYKNLSEIINKYNKEVISSGISS